MFGAWRRGSASALGAESRWFKSSRPDHFGVVTVCRDSFFFICRQVAFAQKHCVESTEEKRFCKALCVLERGGMRSSSVQALRLKARPEMEGKLRRPLPEDAGHVSAAVPSAVFLQRIFCAAWKKQDRAFRKIGAWSAMFFRKPVRIAAEPCDDGAGKRRRRRPLRARKEKIFSGLFFPDANCGRTTGAK